MRNANPANTTFLRWLSLLIISLLSRPADAQSGNGDYDTYTTWNEFVTEYLEQNIDEDALEIESDLRQDLQFMEDLHLRPQNINTAAKEDFLRLAFMTEAQADSILSYRSRKREFFSLGELQFVSDLTPVQRKWLSLFFYAERIDSKRAYAQKGKIRHLFITNLDVPFYKRAGNRQPTEEEYKKNPNCVYWGNALANTVRYRFSRGKQFSAGTTLQKDAGEPFAGCGNYPYDYVSAYAHLISTNGKWQAWLGDFNIRSNHGLLFSSGLFKNTAQINGPFPSKPLQIKPHSSCDETNSFRGLALARQGRVWNAAAFFSLRKLDARLENDTVTSFSKTGFHRTQTELERKNNVRNLTAAMQLGYNKNRLKLAFTFAFDNYDHVVWPKEQPYNLYFMRGKSACAFSCDYHIRSADRKWTHTGESTAPHVRKAHKRKKRRKAATSPPFVALSSTKFNPTSFNLRLELNAPVNRIKPKFNPLQPFAHFVLSLIFSQSTRNSLIYRHSTSFTSTPTLYISFSCPYMAPEMFKGLYSTRTDLYSVGVMMYHLLFGILPWYVDLSNVPVQDRVTRIIEERKTPLKIPNLNIFELDENLLNIIAKAVSQDVDERFQSAEEFLRALNGETEIAKASFIKVDVSGANQKEDKPIETKKGNGFADVAGMSELKHRLNTEIIDLIKFPEKYKKLKVKIPNGMLLYGPPGCGKTFIAEKFAEELGCNYMYVHCSDVASPYIHGGQEKIAALFEQAKENAPTILFLDELDAMIADRSRHTNVSEYGEVNEFLTHLNNCADNHIFVIGATNNPKAIDPAALRSGRLDIKMYVPAPDAESRALLFKLYLKDISDNGINYDKLVTLSERFVSKDISTLVNKAALLTAQADKDKISMDALMSAFEKSKGELPSVSADILKQHEQIRDEFEGNKNNERPKIGFT